jgi:hypothetical protein
MKQFVGLNNFLVIRYLLLSTKYFLLTSDSPSIPPDDFFDFCKNSDIKEIVFGAKKGEEKVEAIVYLVEKTEKVREYLEKKYDMHSLDLTNVILIGFSERKHVIEVVSYGKNIERSVDRIMSGLEELGKTVMGLVGMGEEQ